jgi:hypothetical protein
MRLYRVLHLAQQRLIQDMFLLRASVGELQAILGADPFVVRAICGLFFDTFPHFA